MYKQLFGKKLDKISNDRRKFEVIESDIMKKNGEFVQQLATETMRAERRARNLEIQKQVESLKKQLVQADELVSLYRSQQVTLNKKLQNSEIENQELRQRHTVSVRLRHDQFTLRVWSVYQAGTECSDPLKTDY